MASVLILFLKEMVGMVLMHQQFVGQFRNAGTHQLRSFGLQTVKFTEWATMAVGVDTTINSHLTV
jgi:hypothetical protein